MFSKQPIKNGDKESAATNNGNGTVKKKEVEGLITETLRLVIDSLEKKVDVESFDAVQKKEFFHQIQEHLETVLRESHRHLSYGDKQKVVQSVYDEMFGFGPINSLVLDPKVSEIMVNSFDNIYVEREGRLSKTDLSFRDNNHVLHVINKIINPIGRRIDESCPSVDARLPDGSRVNAIIPPLALKGPSMTIRKFSAEALKTDDLIDYGTLTEKMALFIKACVRARLNIIVSGGTGSGKTTTLNTLSSYIPERERIVTIEDTAELKLSQDNVVTLESRPANIEGRGEYTIRELVRNSLRMRPDRIVIGEVRGGEALDMLQAMNTGHDGSISTLHSNSPRDTLARLETMVLMAGMELPLRAVREQVAAAINLIIHQARLSDGSRKIVKISEVTGIDKEGITIKDLFAFKQTGIDSQGMVIGEHTITGLVPQCLEKLASYGESIIDSFSEWQIVENEVKEEEVREKEIVKIVYVKEETASNLQTDASERKEADVKPVLQEDLPVIPVREEQPALLPEAELEETIVQASETPEVEEELEVESFVSCEESGIIVEEQSFYEDYFSEEDISVDEYYQLLLADEIEVSAEDSIESGEKEEELTPCQEQETPAIEMTSVYTPPILLSNSETAGDIKLLPLAKSGIEVMDEPLLEGQVEEESFDWGNSLRVVGFDTRPKEDFPSLLEASVQAVELHEEPQGEMALEVLGEEKEEPAQEVEYKVPDNIKELTQVSSPNKSTGEKAITVPFKKVLADLLEVENLSNLVAVCSGPEKAEVGQSITFLVTVNNKSDVEDLTKVVVTGSKFDVTKKIACLSAGQSRTLEINYHVKESDYPKMENKIIVFALNENGEELVCEEKCAVTVLKPEVKVLNKGPDTAEVGQVITYTIIVTNPGKVPLSNITVMDSKQDWSQKLESLGAGVSQTYEAKYTVTEDDYPTLESIVTVKAKNIHGMEVTAEDMHNVFIEHKKEAPKVEEKPGPRKIEVLQDKKEGGQEKVVQQKREVSIASLIPENMRGVSLLLNEVTALSGLVQVGDRVDVYLISSEKEAGQKAANQLIAENTIFLKENRIPAEKRERAVFLAVTPEQAVSLAAAYGMGSFYLVLRPSNNDADVSDWKENFLVG